VTVRYHRSRPADEVARRGFAAYARDPLPGLSAHGLRLSPGIPLFRATFEDALRGSVLENVRLIGWRYFAFDEERAIVGDVVRDGRLTLTHIFGGSLVNRTLDAVSHAERLAAAEHAPVLLLNVPSVVVTAVWLATEEPWLILIEDKVRRMRSHTFVEYVHRRAVAREHASRRAAERDRKRRK
jgi:hypothetical protein